MSEPMGTVDMTSDGYGGGKGTPEERYSNLMKDYRRASKDVSELKSERRLVKDVIYNLITDLERIATLKGSHERNMIRMEKEIKDLYSNCRKMSNENLELQEKVDTWKRQAEVHRQQRDYEMTQPAVAPEERKKRPASYGKLRPKAHWGKLPEAMEKRREDREDREEVENE